MKNDRIILGRDAIYSSDCEKTGINNNVIVCGSSGCGKTMSISEPRLIETHNTSLIVTVTKRRIVEKYKATFEERGYKVLDLNFVTPSDSNVSYDPLRYAGCFSDLTYLAEAIVMSDPRKERSNADPYWDKAATSLLTSLIILAMKTKKKASFNDVLELYESLDFNTDGEVITTALDKKFDALAEKEPRNMGVSCWKSFRKLPSKTASCVFGSLNAMVDRMFTPELRAMMSIDNPLDFRSIGTEKTVLFITTSAVNPALNSFINIFYSQAIKNLFEFAEKRPDGKLPVPVHMICDDFATGGKILNFPEYISIFREKQISVTLLIQSESQLESMYGSDDATTIINNCDTYLYMGGMDLKTGRSISERANLPLEDVLYMPIGQEFIFRRGEYPLKTQRYNILDNEQYRKITKEYEKKLKSMIELKREKLVS